MVRKVHKYADGGKVVKDHLEKPKAPPPPKPVTPPPEVLGSGTAQRAADALKNARRKQEEDLGL